MIFGGSGSSKLSENVVEFILTRDINQFESLNVSAIAQKFNVNRCYLSQRFKADTKYNLHEYIAMIKVLRSLVLLQEERKLTIGEVAKRMGFSNPEYFRNVFKKRVGITPGKYRNYFKKTNRGGNRNPA